MTDIVFVILHYLTEQETIEAVEHIELNCDTDNYKIIIVDNFSPNNSYDILKQRFESDEKIELVKTNENLGFARGNNVGYRIAKEKYDPKYIVLLNNDVFVKEKQLFSKLENEYEKSKFAVAGPLVEGPDRSDSPELPEWQRHFPTIDYCNFRIKDMKERIFWGRLGLYRKVCPFLRHRIYNKLNIFQNPGTPIAGINDDSDASKIYDVVIHGCCIIFSREYIDKYDGLDDRTFMYGEESILFVRVLGGKQRTVYMPEIKVFHKGAVATKKADNTKNVEKKFVLAFKRDKLSYEIVKEYLENFKIENGMELYEWWNQKYVK